MSDPYEKADEIERVDAFARMLEAQRQSSPRYTNDPGIFTSSFHHPVSHRLKPLTKIQILERLFGVGLTIFPMAVLLVDGLSWNRRISLCLTVTVIFRFAHRSVWFMLLDLVSNRQLRNYRDYSPGRHIHGVRSLIQGSMFWLLWVGISCGAALTSHHITGSLAKAILWGAGTSAVIIFTEREWMSNFYETAVFIATALMGIAAVAFAWQTGNFVYAEFQTDYVDDSPKPLAFGLIAFVTLCAIAFRYLAWQWRLLVKSK